MKRPTFAAVVVLLSAFVFTGCNGDDEPTPADTAGASTTTDPTPSVPTDEPVIEGAADLDCLVGGSPWNVDTDHLAGQFSDVLQGIDVTDVNIVGGQTLTVDDGLNATFTADLTTTIKVNMGSGLDMEMVQTQKGDSSGTWEADGNVLNSSEPWQGELVGETAVSINGQSSGAAPFEAPSVNLANQSLTFSCTDGELAMSVEGSPFSYLWN